MTPTLQPGQTQPDTSTTPAVAEQPSQRALCLKPHHAGDTSQLELAVNDIVCVLEKDASGWWGGHKEGEETTGWFPGSCVREIIDKEKLMPAGIGQGDLASAVGLEPPPGDEGGEKKGRRLSPVWNRVTRDSSPGFSHTVDIEFSRKSDDRFQSIQLIRPSSPASSIASGSLPSGMDQNKEIKRLRELVGELRHVKRQCDTEIRQQRNNVSQLEAEAAAKRAENAQLQQQLRASVQREEQVTKEIEGLRQELQREKQSSKQQIEQLKRELDEKNLEVKLLAAASASQDSSSMKGSAEALRQRLFATTASLMNKPDDLESISSSGQVSTSGASKNDHLGSPSIKQCEPKASLSTVSTIDEATSNSVSSSMPTSPPSSVSTAVGVGNPRISMGRSMVLPRPGTLGKPGAANGSISLPISSGGLSMPSNASTALKSGPPSESGAAPASATSALLAAMHPNPAQRTLYTPSTAFGAADGGDRSPGASSRSSLNSSVRAVMPKMSNDSNRKPVLTTSGYVSPGSAMKPRI